MADGYISQIKTPDNKVYLLKDSEKGYNWNAITQGQKWSRICLITPTVITEGSSGILSVSCTRASVVCNATFLITTSHPSKCFINTLGTTKYSAVRIRGIVQSNGTAYIELYDTANSIASGTAQTWHCSYTPILSSTVTTYTSFTDGTTLPSGYTAVNDFTAPQGDNSAPVVSISRDGTTFTATRSNGSTFTFTQQDNNTTYTFENGTNGFKVTPLGGTAQTVTVTPSITNNITGSGTTNYLTKFTGTNTIGNSGLITDTNNNLTIPGSIYFGDNASSGKAILSFSSTYPKYGIWYKDANKDIMSFSSSNNADKGTSADFAIEGGGKLYNKGSIIPNTGNTTGDIGGVTTPVYVDAGVIKAGTALKDLAYISKGSGTTKFLREDGTWQTALTSHQSLNGVVHIRNNQRSYTTNISTYVGGTGKKYARIKLPDSVATIWGMYQIEVSIRYNWGHSQGGKVLINLYHNSTSPYNWAAFHAEAFGDFTDALQIYGSDGKYIYIQLVSDVTTYTNISINKVLVGDAAGTADISSIGIDWADELPTTYQTAQVYRSVLEKGTDTSWNISITGTAAKATADASGNTITSTYATKTEIEGLLAAADAMIFKGVINATDALPNSHKAGDTYRVGTAGTYPIVDSNGRYCEIGTLIICTTEGTAANAAHWTAVETNEDGAIIGPASSTANQIAKFSSGTGRVITNSGVTIDDNNIITSTGSDINITAYKENNGEHGIFFRSGYFNNTANKYNLSIITYDHSSNNVTPDGLSINANDGISFCTGSNNRNERARITKDGLVGIGTTTPDKLLTVNGTSNFKDTMTITGASINMSKAGELGIEVDNTQATNPNKIAFIVGSSGNGGIYSRKHSKWIVYASAGGTVVLNGNANTATKLETARNLGVALDSTTAVTFDGSANQTSIPVSGTLGITHGGTGATSAADARTNLNTVTGNARVFYGTCATAAATTLKEVICAEYDKVLTIGDMLIVKFDNTNSGAVGSLQITVKNSTSDSAGTTAKNIKRQYNSTGANNLVATGELNKDSIAVFVYNGTYWILTNADYNNTYSYDWTTGAGGNGRTAETAANGGVGIHRYSLQMMTLNLTWSSLSSDYPTAATTNGAVTDKTVATCSFLLDSPIIYQDTNANATPGNSANVNGFTTGAINLQYSTTNAQWSALTIQKPVYLIGTLQSDGTFKLNATKWWTQTLPTSDDGQIYIFLGLAYSATNIYLHDAHPIYWYKNGEIQPYAGYATATSRAAITTTANAVAYYTNTTGTFGSKASADGTLYATSANGALQWGTLPIAQGGTGVTSFTKNHVILSDNTNGTTGLTSRAYSDSTSAGALSNTSTNFVTERDVYFGLPTLNNAHNYASSSTYYAPTTGGTAGHILIGAGATTAPAWYGGTVMSGTAAASWITAFNGTTDATATNAAAVTIAGGLGIAKKLHVGDTATVPDLTIGSTNEYGDAYTPIYWHEGVPTTVTLVQQCGFTIKSGKSGVKLSHAAITANSYVTEIVITSGESKLNSAISWTSASGYIELTCSSTVSGDVTGYIMISRGGEITATATDIT